MSKRSLKAFKRAGRSSCASGNCQIVLQLAEDGRLGCKGRKGSQIRGWTATAKGESSNVGWDKATCLKKKGDVPATGVTWKSWWNHFLFIFCVWCDLVKFSRWTGSTAHFFCWFRFLIDKKNQNTWARGEDVFPPLPRQCCWPERKQTARWHVIQTQTSLKSWTTQEVQYSSDVWRLVISFCKKPPWQEIREWTHARFTVCNESEQRTALLPGSCSQWPGHCSWSKTRWTVSGLIKIDIGGAMRFMNIVRDQQIASGPTRNHRWPALSGVWEFSFKSEVQFQIRWFCCRFEDQKHRDLQDDDNNRNRIKYHPNTTSKRGEMMREWNCWMKEENTCIRHEKY